MNQWDYISLYCQMSIQMNQWDYISLHCQFKRINETTFLYIVNSNEPMRLHFFTFLYISLHCQFKWTNETTFLCIVNSNEPMRLHFFTLSIQMKTYYLILFSNEGELDDAWVNQTNMNHTVGLHTLRACAAITHHNYKCNYILKPICICSCMFGNH